jgi:hypothetical protein
MIVKNEEHIIVETLTHLHTIFNFDYWVISDTGSTDTTKELIKNFFKEKNVEGELIENEWKWFGPSRTDALNAAYNKSDYLLIFDADDRIEGKFVLPDNLVADQYLFKFSPFCCYYRPLLINNRKRWKFKGIIHELLNCLDNVNSSITLIGDYYVESRRLGNFNLDPQKYNKQARILEKEYYKEIELQTDIPLAHRYAYYCARSYRDGRENDNALIWFKKVVEENLYNWTQEKYCSCIEIGDKYREQNKFEEALHYYLKSTDFDNERIEGVYNAINLLRDKNLQTLALILYNKFQHYNLNIDTTNRLFVNLNIYNNMDMEFQTSIMAYYRSGEHNLGYECCKKILNNQNFNSYNYLQNINNLCMPNFKSLILKDDISEISKITLSLTKYIEFLYNNNKGKKDYLNVFDLWNYVYLFTPETTLEKYKEVVLLVKIITDYNEPSYDKILDLMRKYIFGTHEHHLTNLLYEKYKHIQLNIKNKDFYFMIRHFESISASYTNSIKNGYDCCKELILNDIDFDKDNLFGNFRFYITEINNETDAQRLQLLTKIYSYILSINNVSLLTNARNIYTPYLLRYGKDILREKNFESYIVDYEEKRHIEQQRVSITKEFDFGIIKISETISKRVLKVIDSLQSQGFTINIIDIFSPNKNTELLKCKAILNVFDSEINNIFYYIQFDTLLMYNFLVLSEDTSHISNYYISKYNNLHFLAYDKLLCRETITDFFKIKDTSKLAIQEKYKSESAKLSNKILIYTGFHNELWNYTISKTKSLGGSEKAVAYLAKELPEKFTIYVCGDVKEETVENVIYINHVNLNNLLQENEFYTIIVSRFLNFFTDYAYFRCHKLVLAAHDAIFINPDITSKTNILKKYDSIIDYYICLTEWHKTNIKNMYKDIIDETKIRVINNGINTENFKPDLEFDSCKHENSFVYTSSSDRGLSRILELWPEILNKFPNATLNICSYLSFPNSQEDEEMNQTIQKYSGSIKHLGKLNEKELLELTKQSQYWLYPLKGHETSCITALEMLLSEVICIYYPITGLADTIGMNGIKTSKGNEIQCIYNLTDYLKKLLRKNGKAYALSCSWKQRAKEWSNILELE